MAKVAAARSAPGAGRRGPHAAVGELPGQGVRLAGDARPPAAPVRLALRRLGHGPGYGLPATVIVLAYLWLPYMILPIYAGLERLPELAAGGVGRPRRAGPGARSGRWCCRWSCPSIVAGSIFTFSLSLGDYITVQIVGGKTQLIGNVVYANIGAPTTCRSRRRSRTIPVVDHGRATWSRCAAPARWRTCEPCRAPAAHRCSRRVMALGPGVHLRAAGHRAGQLVQRRPDVRLAAAAASPPSGGGARRQNPGARDALRGPR